MLVYSPLAPIRPFNLPEIPAESFLGSFKRVDVCRLARSLLARKSHEFNRTSICGDPARFFCRLVREIDVNKVWWVQV